VARAWAVWFPDRHCWTFLVVRSLDCRPSPAGNRLLVLTVGQS